MWVWARASLLGGQTGAGLRTNVSGALFNMSGEGITAPKLVVEFPFGLQEIPY